MYLVERQCDEATSFLEEVYTESSRILLEILISLAVLLGGLEIEPCIPAGDCTSAGWQRFTSLVVGRYMLHNGVLRSDVANQAWAEC